MLRPMWQRLRASLATLDREVAWIFVASIVLQTLFWYFARVPFMQQHFPAPAGASPYRQLQPVLLHWGASFLLFGVGSLAVITLVLRRPLSHMGLRLPDGKGPWLAALLSYLVFASPIVLGGRWMPDVAAEYPMVKVASWPVLGCYLLCYLVYYVGWEIHFRGFMLFGLAPKIGPWPAIFVQTIPSVLVHAGKPPGETFAALIAGVVWGWIALETRSIVPVLFAHWLIGVTNDTLMSLWFHGL
jgi:uncharacterized protein